MLEGFEDAFVDAQARSVSLCIELLEGSDIDVEYIYIYIYIKMMFKIISTFFLKKAETFLC